MTDYHQDKKLCENFQTDECAEIHEYADGPSCSQYNREVHQYEKCLCLNHGAVQCRKDDRRSSSDAERKVTVVFLDRTEECAEFAVLFRRGHGPRRRPRRLHVRPSCDRRGPEAEDYVLRHCQRSCCTESDRRLRRMRTS